MASVKKEKTYAERKKGEKPSYNSRKEIDG